MGNARGPKKWSETGAAMMLLVALAACATSPVAGAFPEPPQPHATVSEIQAGLTAALPNADGQFTELERKRLAAFLDAYRDGGRGPLRVTVTAVDAATAGRAVDALRTLAGLRGVVEDAVVTASTVGVRSGMVLGYTDFVAVPPACNPEMVLSRNPSAEVSPNLGCALERSIAAMIAHPADLLAPTAEVSADGNSRGRVIDLHRQGKATGAEASRNDDAKAAAISTSVGLSGK